MSTRTILLPDDVHQYLLACSSREPQVLAKLREVTAAEPEAAAMQIGPEQGQLMALLVRLIGARRCIEIGTYTGYSALVHRDERVDLSLLPIGEGLSLLRRRVS